MRNDDDDDGREGSVVSFFIIGFFTMFAFIIGFLTMFAFIVASAVVREYNDLKQEEEETLHTDEVIVQDVYQLMYQGRSGSYVFWETKDALSGGFNKDAQVAAHNRENGHDRNDSRAGACRS